MNDIDELADTFECDGVVVLRGILAADEVNGLRRDVEAQLAQFGASPSGYDFEAIGQQVWNEAEIDTHRASRFDFAATRERVMADPEARSLLEPDDGTGRTGRFFYDAAGWRRLDGIREVALDSALPEAIAGLLRTPTLHFWEDTTFVKEPGTRQKTAFHQDLAYFQISGEQCAIVWMPLDATDASNGRIEYVRGSHRDPITYAPNVFFAQTLREGAPDPRLPDIEGNRADYDIVSFDTEPGDVIVHHVRTIHGAGGNMSGQRRRAVSLRYCGEDIRYLERDGAVPQMDITHTLKDGDRLYSADYPLVWPRPWPGFKLSDAFARAFPHWQQQEEPAELVRS